MSDQAALPLKSIRLLFELERADNPRLYDDLIRFNKGTKRVNRLRTLAQQGLLLDQLPSGLARTLEATDQTPDAPRSVDITNQVFDEPLVD